MACPLGFGTALLSTSLWGSTHTTPRPEPDREGVVGLLVTTGRVFLGASKKQAKTHTRLSSNAAAQLYVSTSEIYCSCRWAGLGRQGSLSSMELEQTNTLLAKPNIAQTIQKEVIPRGGCFRCGRASVPLRAVRLTKGHTHPVSLSHYHNFVFHTPERKYAVVVCDARAKRYNATRTSSIFFEF